MEENEQLRAELLRAALEYAARGWSVIPIGADKRTPPRVRWKKYQTERATESKLREWFARPDVTGLGIVMGPVSGGLWCRDFDRVKPYKDWARAHPDLEARLPTVRSRRGYHVYGRWPGATYARLKDGELHAPSPEGKGHMALAPPSRHKSGVRYAWRTPPSGEIPLVDPIEVGLAPAREPPAEAPAAAAEQRDAPGPGAVPPLAGNATIDAHIDTTIPPEPGHREHSLFDLARRAKFHTPGLSTDPSDHEPIVRVFHAKALRYIGTKDFGKTFAAYKRAYHHARCPVRASLAERAMAAAREAPQPEWLAGLFRLPSQKNARLLAMLCRELQALAGSDDFPLSYATAEALLYPDKRPGERRTQIGRWLLMLERMRVGGRPVLECTYRGLQAKPNTAGWSVRRASRYRYHDPAPASIAPRERGAAN